MKDSGSIDIRKFQARARLPVYLRFAAVALFVVALLVVGIGFYRAKSNAEFRMQSFPTSLSKDVVATVNSYERREIDGDSVKYYIKADRASTFSDNHQELENVYLQVFDAEGSFNEITAAKAVYIPEENKNFTGYFAGDVNIATRDKLKLKTEQISFTKATDTAVAEEAVAFERSNIKGKSFGAILNMANRSIELQQDVQFEIAQADGGFDTVTSGNATYLQNAGIIELAGNANLTSRSGNGSESIDASADRVKLTLTGTADAPNEIKTAEFFERVNFVKTSGSASTKIFSVKASYDRPLDRMDLKGSVLIESHESGILARKITGDSAVYSAKDGRAEVAGNAQAAMGEDLVKGDRIDADLTPAGTIKKAVVTGNAYLVQIRNGESVEVSSGELIANFGANGDIASAIGKGRSEVKQRSGTANAVQQMTIVAAAGLDAVFRDAGAFERFKTDGRTTLTFESPDNGGDSSNKQVTADNVVSTFNADGKSMKRAEAIGNAEFLISPHRSAEANYRVKVNAPRFDCDFFATGNAPSVCIAATSAKMVRTPTVVRDGHSEQIVTATTLTSRFDQASGNISQMDASGKAKFTELDRNATASTFTFTANDEIVRLRGGEPTVWDSRARAKAREIDWDTKNSRSALRGAVSTTYYSSKGLGNSSPFDSSGKPVYITSESAEMNHTAESARYNGNARAWQGGSYVRASTLTIGQKDSTMLAEGSVQSALFNTKAADGADVPVFASAEVMHYEGEKRTVRYDQNVLVRKGTDRITSKSAILWLNEKNELTATEFENDVVIVQPNRKGNSDHARYTSVDEKMVLRGRPAKIDDPEKGSMAGAELTIYLKDKRVFGSGVTNENPTGRVRNTYKIQ